MSAKYILNGLSGNVGSLLKVKFANFSQYHKDLITKDEEVFIHIAAKSQGRCEDIVRSNIDYLLEVIDFCKKNNIKKIVFFSAISIYTKNDLYSTSKLLGEKILKESGLKVLVLRLPMILTADATNGILNRIIHKLEQNKKIVLYNADRKFNNFIGVDDIYDFIINYNFKKDYELVNLASKKDSTLFEIVKFLKSLLNSKSKIIKSKQANDFFNVPLKKAVKKYNFKPTSSKKVLVKWIKKGATN